MLATILYLMGAVQAFWSYKEEFTLLVAAILAILWPLILILVILNEVNKT